MKRQPTEWGKMFANDTSDKGLISKIYKELTKLNTKKAPNNPIKSGQKTWINTSPKRTYTWPIDVWKKCSTSLIIREMQIKTTMRYHLTLSEWLPSINQQTSVGEDVEKGKLSCTVGENEDWFSQRGEQCGIPQKLKNGTVLLDPMIPLLGIYPKKPKTLILRICAPLGLLQCYLQLPRLGSRPSAHQ